ncbi:recombinase family protein [Agrobacterium leguminum]|uniref:recombinase family protein n=1 Tax=Agrobacterium leguminum TaxID=2792015 RepID=UPI003B8A8BC0
MRVSTGEQNLDLQRDGLEKAGCEKIYDDVCSGRATDRPGLAKALEIARAGDALVVWKLDRIGRSLPHVVGLMNDLQQRGVGLKVLTGDMDTTTTTGRLVFGIFATLAEFERDCRSSGRTRPSQGRRPPAMSPPNSASPCRHSMPMSMRGESHVNGPTNCSPVAR